VEMFVGIDAQHRCISHNNGPLQMRLLSLIVLLDGVE